MNQLGRKCYFTAAKLKSVDGPGHATQFLKVTIIPLLAVEESQMKLAHRIASNVSSSSVDLELFLLLSLK